MLVSIMRRRLLLRALLLPLLICLVTSTSACGTSTSGEQDTDADSYEVASRVLDLVDVSRPTDPTPDSPGDEVPGRRLPTKVWYPQGDGPFPVVVFTHGLDSTPARFSDLLQTWAATGLIVVAPTYPLTSSGTALSVQDIFNQPADVSFVLDEVLALDTADDDPLAGKIDADHIAVGGHSAGAMTTLGLFNNCCHDDRITAALVLSGTLYPFGEDFVDTDVPMLFVHGSADESIPFADGEAAFQAYPGPKAAIELMGGTHTTPYNDEDDPAYATVRATSTDYLQWALTGDAQALDDLRADVQKGGAAQLVADQLGG